MTIKKIDKPFFISTLLLVVAGFFIFSSAALGLLARNSAQFNTVLINQIVLGFIGGLTACFIISKIHYTFWKKYAFYFFVLSFISMLLVFIPHVGIFHGGARRWINIAGFSLQPAEFYKIGYVLYLAVWLSNAKQKITTFKHGFLPFLILTVITAGIVLAQPDTDTFLVITLSGVAMYITAGGKWRYLFALGGVGLFGMVGLVFARPYLMQRILTFANPSADPLGSGYQIQQSLIAIGSGGMFGKGFGQSVQKFNFLPEPIGDSIFAVASEEFGFVGAVGIILLYVIFTMRGFKVSTKAPDMFSSLVVVGIITLIVSQSFFNIGAMLAILPLSGTPLLFISHGGTALFFALASIGLILNISRYQTSRK